MFGHYSALIFSAAFSKRFDKNCADRFFHSEPFRPKNFSILAVSVCIIKVGFDEKRSNVEIFHERINTGYSLIRPQTRDPSLLLTSVLRWRWPGKFPPGRRHTQPRLLRRKSTSRCPNSVWFGHPKLRKNLLYLFLSDPD